MPRINRVIELWEAGQPIYHTGAGELTYENGLKQSGTWADYLEIDFENAPFDTVGLLAFMRGLVEAGPTRSGHRTPTVITTLPANCRTREEMLANAWQARAVLSCGVHGILHTHCRQASAVQAFVEACRYPFQTIGIGKGLLHGQRGAGGQRVPAEIWGISAQEYVQRADPWPLNPEGELLLALKLEDRECLSNCEDITAVPGIAFGEWGPGDMGMSFGYADAHDPPYPPEMAEARARIFAAHRANGVRFRTGWRDPEMSEDQRAKKLIDEGIMDVGVGEEGAIWGRAYTKREMPV